MKIIQYLQDGWETDLFFIIDDGKNKKYKDGLCNYVSNIIIFKHTFKYIDPNFKEHINERPFPSPYVYWRREFAASFNE